MPKYHSYIDVWDLISANQLPLHHHIDNYIWLINESTLVIKKVNSLFCNQITIMKEYIDEMFGKDFIYSNNLTYTTPVLIIKKLERSL